MVPQELFRNNGISGPRASDAASCMVQSLIQQKNKALDHYSDTGANGFSDNDLY